MDLLFVTWWSEDHFEYNWHLNPEQVEQLASRGIEVRRLTGYEWNEPWNWTFTLGRLRFIVDLIRSARKADVVVAYMDSFTSRILGMARVLGMVRRPSLVLVDYWLQPSTSPRSLRALAKQVVIRHVYGRFDLILFDTKPGEHSYRVGGYLGTNVRTAFQPLALSTTKLRYLAAARERLGDRARSIAEEYYFASGNSNRDYDTLFAAAKLLPDVRFVVMTTKPTTSELRPDNVSLADWGSYDDYLELLVNARAVIIPMPPSVEAAGLRTIFEAWAMKVPAIVADSEGVATYVRGADGKDLAFRYRAGDAPDLAAVIRAINIEESRRRELVDTAADSLTSGFSSGAYIDRLIPQLLDVVQQ